MVALKTFLILFNLFTITFAEVYSKQSVDCIVQAVHTVAKWKIALEYARENQDFLSDILQKVNIPAVLNALEHRKESGIEHRTSIDVLILLKDKNPTKILNETLWNGDTRFIIIAENEDTIEEYFQQFWTLKVINVFGMVLSHGNDNLYSFLPYGKKNCSKAELLIVDNCVEGQLQNGGYALRETMRIKNMNQCPVNVTITHVRPNVIFEPDEGKATSSNAKGFEGKFMMEVAKVYNFSAIFKIAEDGFGWGWVHPSPRGAIGDVYRGLSDITIGMNGPFMERYEYLDLAVNYNMDECVTFGVPQGYGAKSAEWLTIFVLEFTPQTWILIFFSTVMIGVNVWLINNCLKMNWFQSKSQIGLFLFSSCMGYPIKTPLHTSGRTSVIFWITCSFIIAVSYKASMGSKLTVPPRDPDIDTFKELLESDLELSGVKNMIQILPEDEWPFTEIRRRYRPTEECFQNIVKRMAEHKKISYLRHRSSYYYYSLLIPNARGRIYVIKDCVYPYHPHAVLKKFSPFNRRVSQTIRRLEESGIMEMWRSEYLKKIPPPKKPFFKLSMDQMFGVFCFLLIGYVIAGFIFLYEIYFVFGFWKPLRVLLSPFGFNICKGFVAIKSRCENKKGR